MVESGKLDYWNFCTLVTTSLTYAVTGPCYSGLTVLNHAEHVGDTCKTNGSLSLKVTCISYSGSMETVAAIEKL